MMSEKDFCMQKQMMREIEKSRKQKIQKSILFSFMSFFPCKRNLMID